MSKQRKVIHVELKEPYNGRRNHYFGSVVAIYDKLPPDVVGISAAGLWNVFCKSNTYRGPLAIVRKRELVAKTTNRGKRNENPTNSGTIK